MELKRHTTQSVTVDVDGGGHVGQGGRHHYNREDHGLWVGKPSKRLCNNLSAFISNL